MQPHISTILIIDDEPAARASVEALLFSGGYRLEFAQDGAQGLAMAVELFPDLILLDVMMPGMDGYEVCRRLRADPILADVPVVMITALDDHEARMQGIQAGADDFITKPYDKTELRTRVGAICRLNRYRKLLTERIGFQWLIDQSPDAYLILSPEGEIRYANTRARLFLHLSEDVQGQNFLDIIPGDYRREPPVVWQTWEENPEVLIRPAYLVRPETYTSQAVWLEVTELALPQGAGKRILRLRDVSESLNNDAGMRTFQTSLTHKFFTPMTNILFSLRLLKMTVASSGDSEIVKLAESAYGSVERLNETLKTIFKYLTMPVLARSGEQAHLSSIPALAADMAKTLNLVKHKVVISAAIENKILTLSSTALESILWEVLENARKFHPENDPQIEIRALPDKDRSNFARILIVDDGTSLSPEQIRWAMTPYLQGEKIFTGEEQGMGLGLPLVGKLVWQVGGDVHLYNRNDRSGVIIELLLPLASSSTNLLEDLS